jgi:hypothetical protein
LSNIPNKKQVREKMKEDEYPSNNDNDEQRTERLFGGFQRNMLFVIIIIIPN